MIHPLPIMVAEKFIFLLLTLRVHDLRLESKDVLGIMDKPLYLQIDQNPFYNCLASKLAIMQVNKVSRKMS